MDLFADMRGSSVSEKKSPNWLLKRGKFYWMMTKKCIKLL